MTITTNIISSALVFFLLAACAEGQEKQTLGTIAGAGLGALVGSQVGSGKGQIVGVAIGAMAGAWLGSEAGKSLDETDNMHARHTAQQTLEYNKTGQVSSWQNPDSGNYGTYMPTRSYTSENKNCRQFDTTITVDGKTEAATGRACRDAEGKWRFVP